MCAFALLFAAHGHAAAFGFDDVAERARQLAARPYAPASVALPAELKELSYDQYRDIRFNPEKALWRKEGLPFELMFFHLGKFQTQPVSINEIVGGQARHIAFDRQDFNYGKNTLSQRGWGDLGFAGFRVHYALNNPAYKDELVVFLGASYFRALGKGLHYGLSARGLGIDTVGGAGEEFPRFTEFWIERPSAQATSLVIHALLDSQSATGAYRFTFQPGTQTLVDVQARLFLRSGVATLGIAPLTSMFQHGENQPRPNDFRPEVHDSDGLMIATGDGAGGSEWLWRPLVNPKQTLVNSFVVRELKGFGLMQRDRSYASYEDTEAQYQQRPSVWVTPQGNWGPGRVELLQLHTPDETNDNVVAYWVPERTPAPGQPLDVAYRMQWQGEPQQRPPAGWAVQTRRGHGFIEPKAKRDPNEVQYVVDFDGPALRALPADAPVKAVVSAGTNARIVESNAYLNAATGTWRMTVRTTRLQPAQPAELRAFLQNGDHALTETWTTIIQPE
ncbi:MAG TPA: glucan biosynthesis protein G [Rhizobacter sp.]|nr:glucan biosynthesis protein G [Rhizobacter sp.]